MGNLYGSEYGTYLLPRRLGETSAKALLAQRLPLLDREADAIGLIDHCEESLRERFEERCLQHALALSATYNLPQRLVTRQATSERDETLRPLAHHREQELARMHCNFYGFDPSTHVGRHHFGLKMANTCAPRHLSVLG
jgi:putative two-component system hydrogenase maturation factor HypX/HoxX